MHTLRRPLNLNISQDPQVLKAQHSTKEGYFGQMPCKTLDGTSRASTETCAQLTFKTSVHGRQYKVDSKLGGLRDKIGSRPMQAPHAGFFVQSFIATSTLAKTSQRSHGNPHESIYELRVTQIQKKKLNPKPLNPTPGK